MWEVQQKNGRMHVIPQDDLRPHQFDNCWCLPRDDDGIAVHNSMDRREFVERGEALVN